MKSLQVLNFPPHFSVCCEPSPYKNCKYFNGLYRHHVSQSFSDVRVPVRVRKFRTLKTLRTRTQRVCLFTHLYCKEVNISQEVLMQSSRTCAPVALSLSWLQEHLNFFLAQKSYLKNSVPKVIILGQVVGKSESEFRTSVGVRVRRNGRVRKALMSVYSDPDKSSF
jgi:hypothetical protein